MILNLEAEKTVDSSKRLGVVSGYSQLRTTLSILGLIVDLTFQLLHGLYTWWHRCVDKHRNGKIALGELYRDHCQMLTNGLLANCVAGPVRFYLDRTALSQEMEVVGCLFAVKTHTLIATGIYTRKMVFRVWGSLLGNCAQTRGAKYIEEKKVKNFHSIQRI